MSNSPAACLWIVGETGKLRGNPHRHEENMRERPQSGDLFAVKTALATPCNDIFTVYDYIYYNHKWMQPYWDSTCVSP